MWLNELWQGWLGRTATSGRGKTPAPRRPRLRLTVEALEVRTVPSNFTAGNVPELIAAVDAANQTPEADTIALVAGTTFTLTEQNNTTNGYNGLPTIVAGENLTIVGNGGIIERSTAAGTPHFRLFNVAAGASLTLENQTLQGGLAYSEGGAIHNQGTLTLRDVTVQNNRALGGTQFFTDGYSRGLNAAGGGIYSSGTLTLDNSTIQNNQAKGGPGVAGGNAFGGGLYVSGGTGTLSHVVLVSNSALGGDGGTLRSRGSSSGGPGGNGLGGGMYVAGGTVALHDCSVTDNAANGGAGGSGRPRGSRGEGIGGGLYIEADALVCLDAFTESNVKRNQASTSGRNIAGPYTVCP